MSSDAKNIDEWGSFDGQKPSEFTLQTLEHHKAEGMRISVRARIIAIVVVIGMLPILNPTLPTLYYMAFALLFILNGLAQMAVAKVGRSRLELLLFSLDLILLTFIIIVPNPFQQLDAPLELQYRFNGHAYMYIYLALGTLAYSWRTVRFYGVIATLVWSIGLFFVWMFSTDHPSTKLFQEAMEPYSQWAPVIDPSNIRFDLRFQEIVVFAIVAFILSLTVKRFSDLLLKNASVERERTNLARYFSPNMVDSLSQNDDPLKVIKTQNVAVLFVDIVGFTTYSNQRKPEEVIKTLREFHQLMEACVFNNGGTLDKFLGDGLMATFGTPEESENDATNALKCATAMLNSVKQWNETRIAAGDEEIRIGLGLHYGPCVLGDIGGGNRLEFAVIGDTVNIASRVEAKTRELGVKIAITEEMVNRIKQYSEDDQNALTNFEKFEAQEIRGLNHAVTLYGANITSLH